MSRLFAFLIIFGGLTGGYFVYQDYAANVKAKSNHWAADIRNLIKEHLANAKEASGDAPGSTDSMAYFRMLAMMHNSEQHHYVLGDTMRAAFSGSGVSPGESKMSIDLVLENYHLAKQLGAFDSTANLLRLERGEPPVCRSKGWDGETLVTGFLISPLLAPEASYSLANILLMPKTVRDTQNEDLVGVTPEMAKKWLAERLISMESHQNITKALEARKF